MTKMAAMAIYGKNLKKSSSPEPKGQWPWILVCIIGCLSTTKFAQFMTLGWPLPIFWQDQIWSLMLLNGRKVKQWIFQKLLSSMWFETGNRWLKWQEVSVDLKTLSPGGCMPLPRGYIHVLNHEKKCIKSRFLWNLQQMGKVIRPFCWHQNLVPWGLSVPVLGLYICIKSWRKLYKIRLQRHFFETCNKWMKWQDVPVDIKFCPKGVVSPCPGICILFPKLYFKCQKFSYI